MREAVADKILPDRFEEANSHKNRALKSVQLVGVSERTPPLSLFKDPSQLGVHWTGLSQDVQTRTFQGVTQEANTRQLSERPKAYLRSETNWSKNTVESMQNTAPITQMVFDSRKPAISQILFKNSSSNEFCREPRQGTAEIFESRAEDQSGRKPRGSSPSRLSKEARDEEQAEKRHMLDSRRAENQGISRSRSKLLIEPQNCERILTTNISKGKENEYREEKVSRPISFREGFRESSSLLYGDVP
jgi:hypothetical protein